MKTNTKSAVKTISPLGFPWKTADPFLFTVHHDDTYQRRGPNEGVRPTFDTLGLTPLFLLSRFLFRGFPVTEK